MEYNYPEHHVDSVFSAIELAEQLKNSGEYDLFRGQRRNYEIRPSVHRPGTDIEKAQDALNTFYQWVHETPDLSSLHGDEKAILAVAQHYGIQTPLLDFSRSPKIAGFFACDGAKQGDTGTIICLNKRKFKESWEDLNGRYYKDEGRLLTELISIDVRNLWRLQAQEGEFLKCHVDPNLLEMFSYFLHIYFPQQEEIEIIENTKIYPTQKSHLEVLLDQYFLIDSYPDRFRQLEEMYGHVIYSSVEDDIRLDIATYFENGEVPNNHSSWESESAKRWLCEPDEHYIEHEFVRAVKLIIPSVDRLNELESRLEEQLALIFEGLLGFVWAENRDLMISYPYN